MSTAISIKAILTSVEVLCTEVPSAEPRSKLVWWMCKCFVTGEHTGAQTAWGQLNRKTKPSCSFLGPQDPEKRPQPLSNVMGNNSFDSVICSDEKKKEVG